MTNYREDTIFGNYLFPNELSLQGFVYASCYLEHTPFSYPTLHLKFSPQLTSFSLGPGSAVPCPEEIFSNVSIWCLTPTSLVLFFLSTPQEMFRSLTCHHSATHPEFAKHWDHYGFAAIALSRALGKAGINKYYLNITFLMQVILIVGTIKCHVTKGLGTTGDHLLVLRCVLVHSQELWAHWERRN